jgi:ferredoxin
VDPGSEPERPHGEQQRAVATTTREAIDRTETLLCGIPPVRSVAEAEGLALAGVVAATSVESAEGDPVTTAVPTVRAPWVHHRVGRPVVGASDATLFELVASDAQEAVDHCVAAHRLARSTGTPVVCVIDPVALDRFSFVRFPQAPRLDVGPEPAERIGELAARILGAAGVLPTHRVEDAELLLIAAGEDRRRAVRLADRLRDVGVHCGVVGLALTRPFPAQRLRELVGERTACLVGTAGEIARRELGSVPWIELESHDGRELELPASLTDSLGLEGQAASPRSEDHGETTPALSIAIDPPGDESERILLDVATALAERSAVDVGRVACAPGEAATMTVDGEPPDLVVRVDVGLLLHPSAKDGRGAESLLARMDERSRLFIVTDETDPVRIWAELGPIRRAWIKRRRPLLYRAVPEPALPGTIARCVRSLRVRTDGTEDGSLSEAWIRANPEELDEALASGSETGGPGSQRVPDTEGGTRERTAESLRRFHLTGRASDANRWAGPLETLAGRALVRTGDAWERYPFVLGGAEDGGDTPFLDWAVESIERAASDAAVRPEILLSHRALIPRIANRILRDSPDRSSPATLLREVLQALPVELDLSEAGRTELLREIAGVDSLVEQGGQAVAFDRGTLNGLLLETVRGRRRPMRSSFREQVESIVGRVDELLQSDERHGPSGGSPEALRSTLGPGQRFVDSETLARTLPAYRGSRRIEPDRRRRMEHALVTLRNWLANREDEPDVVVVGIGPGGEAEGVRQVTHGDPLRASIGLFDGYARSFVEVARAIRTARLDLAGEYDPELHDGWIRALDTEAFSFEELLQLPAIVVLDRASRIAEQALGSLSTLLRSGRPVLVVASEEGAIGAATDAEPGYDPGLGYLSIAHREAFVLQSTLAFPAHLTEGLARMAEIHRPSVAVVLEPRVGSTLAPWPQLRSALWGRWVPCFRYDPLAGPTWAERFSLSENPQPESAWPALEIEAIDEAGRPATFAQRFTTADALAAEPWGRRRMQVIDREDWAQDQLELVDYLALPEEGQRRRVPYLWVRREDEDPARAILTRELACVAADRGRAWRVLQELAGYHNEHALRAADLARAQTRAEAEAERESLAAEHEQALARVRAEAAGEAIDRLVAVLMDLDSVAPPATTAPRETRPGSPPASTPQEVSEPSPEAAAPVPETPQQPADDLSFDEPYIDSVLCTTCNECINLNPALFVYNENRQATLGDPAKGTFEELVKAAEKCPARCIHPGAPRPDDSTATDELRERARGFN